MRMLSIILCLKVSYSYNDVRDWANNVYLLLYPLSLCCISSHLQWSAPKIYAKYLIKRGYNTFYLLQLSESDVRWVHLAKVIYILKLTDKCI